MSSEYSYQLKMARLINYWRENNWNVGKLLKMPVRQQMAIYRDKFERPVVKEEKTGPVQLSLFN